MAASIAHHAAASSADIHVQWIGLERNPVVVIDHLASDPDALRTIANDLRFDPFTDQYYPGERALAPPEYFAATRGSIAAVLHDTFGCATSEALHAYYSVASRASSELDMIQRIPHYDAIEDGRFAAVHFLGAARFGGTAFFRQRSTGYETITERRARHYHATLDAELERIGAAPAYIDGDTEMFVQIASIEARYNRAIVFRGDCLHSGAIPNGVDLPRDPANGRLSVVTFLVAR